MATVYVVAMGAFDEPGQVRGIFTTPGPAVALAKKAFSQHSLFDWVKVYGTELDVPTGTVTPVYGARRDYDRKTWVRVETVTREFVE